MLGTKTVKKTVRNLDGQDIVVGINTDKPYSRLSLGDNSDKESVSILTNNDNLLSEIINSKLKLISTTTREDTPLMGRMTEWLQNGKFKINTGSDLNLETDRVMICGSLDMLQDHKNICLKKGMIEGSNSNPGHFVIEKAFVD